MKKSGVVSAAAALTLAAVFAACSGSGHERTGKQEPMRVHVYRATMEPVTDDIISFGSLMHTKKNDLSSAVDGTLEELPFREGDPVLAGAVLARLSNIQLTINLDQARSASAAACAAAALAEAQYHEYRSQLEARFLSLEKAERELVLRKHQLELLRTDTDNAEVLHLVGGLSGEQLRNARYSLSAAESEYEKLALDRDVLLIGLRDSDIAQAGLDIPANDSERRALLVDLNSRTKLAELRVARAQEETSKTQEQSAEALVGELEVTAPSAGILGAVYKEEGERIEAGEKILTIMEADQLLAVVPVNEKETARLVPGMTAEVVIEALGDGSVPGIVDSISPLIDPQSGNATIKIRFDNPGGKARPGMFARIRLTASEATQKMLVPRSCLVLREENRAVVLTVSNNRVFRREVVPGDDHRDRTEILSGLREGDVLVMDPAPLLHEGDEVVIDETE